MTRTATNPFTTAEYAPGHLATASAPSRPHADPTTGAGTTAPQVSRSSTAALRLLVLAVGPAVSVLVLVSLAGSSQFPDTFTHYAAWAALAMWSPLPCSLPAVLLDADRDAALPRVPRLLRAVILIPWMVLFSPARVEVAVSLCAWASAIYLASSLAAL